ncbi:uncharacterized protein CIMG_05530 [Coccidioides immitis RS]|uniref:Uncharacterized protein n=2 Tax=Coccidioides immitis TaxID=5501 RepID=J3KFS6_COCIM|nr:uncharacterized protein CIMG_05530 [Coccidioides immitis RS]EAS34506.3 hypothetical protein CIMG_05530 [Coccidioides immitis RS]
MSLDKPRLDHNTLKEGRISCFVWTAGDLSAYGQIHRSDECPSRLPGRVESLMEALLSFDFLIPDRHRETFAAECAQHEITSLPLGSSLVPPESAYLEDFEFQTPALGVAKNVIEREIEEFRAVAERSRDLCFKNATREQWQHFLHSYVFKSFEDTFSPLTRYEASNVHWDEAKKYPNVDRSATQPIGPKPDLTYGIPILRPCDLDGLPKGFRDLEQVTNFTIESLGTLCSAGLTSSPQSGVSKWTKDKRFPLNQNHLVCFPWAAVELSPVEEEQQPIDFCYYQAANTASAALKLLEGLYTSSGTFTIDSSPPVVMFTCHGPELGVWLAYSCSKGFGPICYGYKLLQKMVRIWTSSLNLTWGVIATCQIVKNLLFWASRCFKPQISACISQIRFSPFSPLRRKLLGVSHVRGRASGKPAQDHETPVSDTLNANSQTACDVRPPKPPTSETTPVAKRIPWRGRRIEIWLPRAIARSKTKDTKTPPTLNLAPSKKSTEIQCVPENETGKCLANPDHEAEEEGYKESNRESEDTGESNKDSRGPTSGVHKITVLASGMDGR